MENLLGPTATYGAKGLSVSQRLIFSHMGDCYLLELTEIFLHDLVCSVSEAFQLCF